MKKEEIENLITKGIDESFLQFTINRDVLWTTSLELTLSNQAALQVVLANQAKLFEKLFPEKSTQEHYNDFTSAYDLNRAELSIQLIQKGE